jgi:predicted transcriptional regulator
MSKSEDYLGDDMGYIKTDIQEEQKEMKFPGCKFCGEKLDPENNWDEDFDVGICTSCIKNKEQKRQDLWLTTNIISKVIYGGIGKSDLRVLSTIIYDLAKQDPLAVFEINQTAVAKEHGYKQGNISRSIKKLLEAKLIEKDEETGLFKLLFNKH